jgi:hypothetical protein
MKAQQRMVFGQTFSVFVVGWTLLPFLYDLATKHEPTKPDNPSVQLPPVTPEQLDAAMLYLSQHAVVQADGTMVLVPQNTPKE